VVNPDAPRFAGRRPTAMTLGNVIMQPLQRTPREDASLLLHELAHTGLARLGDEYILRSRRDERYAGQPLRPLNLTTDRSLEKWRHWREGSTHLPAWDDQPIVGAEGAGYFGRGIWRPARRCAMRQSRRGIPFCAVCREALTNGIRRALGADQMLLRVDYPSGEHAFVQVTARGGEPVPLAIPTSGDDAVHLSVTPVAGTIPEPWEITARLTGEGGIDKVVDEQPEPASPTPRSRFAFTAVAGDRLRFRMTSGCPFTPRDPQPVCELDLRCVPGGG
jgi:hypothetical protein